MSFRIAVDAMGGDNAPGAVVRGALMALADDEALELVLIGDEPRIVALLATPDLANLFVSMLPLGSLSSVWSGVMVYKI